MRFPGHPDKVCDLVAESIVDEYLRRDPDARLRVSVAGGRGALFVSGDVRSSADFDVAALVRRVVGGAGVMAEMEPFVSLEPVGPEQAPLFAAGNELPVTVMGYATSETPELVPEPLLLARRIAKRLEDLRQSDESWFWLGADGEVVVHDGGAEKGMTVFIQVEHGAKPIADARKEISAVVASLAPTFGVKVNELGPTEIRGLANVMGASGHDVASYGDLLPSVPRLVGSDTHRAEKAGAWLARHAARGLVVKGSKAALVTATYLPGEDLPASLSARDERGKDLSSQLDQQSFSLKRVMAEWWRPGLNADAVRWGFVGEAGLPWE
ncbi:MAG: S-adenosylmethionine synthetase N-terminal domain-containing protein [Patescibacteria group bacterium]